MITFIAEVKGKKGCDGWKLRFFAQNDCERGGREDFWNLDIDVSSWDNSYKV